MNKIPSQFLPDPKFVEETQRASKYSGLRVNDWPKFRVRWDLNPKNYHYALGRDNKSHYKNDFPSGALVGNAKMEEVLKNLTMISDLKVTETNSNHAQAILFWLENKFMTPPIFDVSDIDGKILIPQGNHRFYICRGKKVDRIYFIADPKYKHALEHLLSSLKWAPWYEIGGNILFRNLFQVYKKLT